MYRYVPVIANIFVPLIYVANNVPFTLFTYAFYIASMLFTKTYPTVQDIHCIHNTAKPMCRLTHSLYMCPPHRYYYYYCCCYCCLLVNKTTLNQTKSEERR